MEFPSPDAWLHLCKAVREFSHERSCASSMGSTYMAFWVIPGCLCRRAHDLGAERAQGSLFLLYAERSSLIGMMRKSRQHNAQATSSEAS